MSLAARGVVYDYPGPLRALDGVDLSLGERELLAVLGPNGSGKSTLLRLLGGLSSPTAGAVTLDGAAVGELPLRERARRIAVVPQSLDGLPDTTVERFVLSGRYARIGRWRGAQGEDRAVVDRALAAADLPGLGSRKLAELSGGQRQCTLVARALAQEAEVLLVDEPTASLDLKHQVGVFSLLAGLGEAGRAAVVVTHDLNLASQFADRVALLDAGRIVAEGPPAEVLRHEVLAPVYGPDLHCGSLPLPDGRPFVLPWKAPR